MKSVLMRLDYSELVILLSALNFYKARLEVQRKKEKNSVAKEKLYQAIFNADKLQDVIDSARASI